MNNKREDKQNDDMNKQEEVNCSNTCTYNSKIKGTMPKHKHCFWLE